MKRTLIIILIFLLTSLGVLIILNFIYKDFDILTYMTGISSFTIAILTVFYVITNSGQWEVMSKQLEEMKNSREYQNQPLPWIDKVSLEIEAPRLFYNPPEDRHSFYSRYRGYMEIINLSDVPAISIDISATILLKTKKDSKTLSSTSYRIDTLAANERYPKTENERKISFLFPLDESAEMFSILRDDSETPIIQVSIVYRNVLGGCFLIENQYQLIQIEDDEDSIEKWHTDIVAFKTKEKKPLENLLALKESKSKEWDIAFESLKTSYKYDNDEIVIKAYSIPGSFKLTTINENDYQTRIEKIFYGRRLKWATKKNKPSA